jgi:metal-responsive CopG/Arc/MetJ family transcriptional regulator
MRTVQMTLDDELVKTVDRVVSRLQTTRSAFTRDALREAVAAYAVKQLEQKHRVGYEKHPAENNEFGGWDAEQAWGDE